MQIKILIVDDEESMCEILKYNLELEGYIVDTALSAEEAYAFDLPSYSLIILDIMMSRISGFDFAKRIKSSQDTEAIPILFCSALNGEDERVMGLNMGADDYIVKPFMVREVVARVRSILRRAGITKFFTEKFSQRVLEPDIVYRDLRIVRNNMICFLRGTDINLTRTEYNLLLFFIINKNCIFSREEIMRKVWDVDYMTFRTIDTNVTRIRKKLEDYGRNIVTRLGLGYGFQE